MHVHMPAAGRVFDGGANGAGRIENFAQKVGDAQSAGRRDGQAGKESFWCGCALQANGPNTYPSDIDKVLQALSSRYEQAVPQG
jgi:hypothetical protein